MTKLYDYMPADQEYIKKLSLEHPISSRDALEIFKLGGKKHSKTICELISCGKSSDYVEGFIDGMKKEEGKKKRR